MNTLKSALESPHFINCAGTLVDISSPRVMGIDNLTPDSFFAGSRKQTESEVVLSCEKMLREGAAILDFGAYSTRPGADNISEAEELDRVNVLKQVKAEFPNAIISIDTFRSSVAKKAVENGAHIINDISGGELDPNMFATIAELQVPYIMMHMRGTPQTMTELTDYPNIMQELLQYFGSKIQKLQELGIKDLILDPGFGFAKTTEQNFEVLKNLEQLLAYGLPVLAGLSRKSMIYKSLDIEPAHALNGTTVLNTIALQQGARILRVHDVKEACEAIHLVKAYETGIA